MEITTVVQRLHSFTLTEDEIRQFVDHPTELAAELERAILPPESGRNNGHRPVRVKKAARGKAAKSSASKGDPKRARAKSKRMVMCPGCSRKMSERNFRFYHKQHCKKLSPGDEAVAVSISE
jgi:hypothetical protein